MPYASGLNKTMNMSVKLLEGRPERLQDKLSTTFHRSLISRLQYVTNQISSLTAESWCNHGPLILSQNRKRVTYLIGPLNFLSARTKFCQLFHMRLQTWQVAKKFLIKIIIKGCMGLCSSYQNRESVFITQSKWNQFAITLGFTTYPNIHEFLSHI